MSNRDCILKAALAAFLAASISLSACGRYEDPNAVIGGKKRLFVRDGTDPTWSPDGGTIIFTRLGHLYSIDYPVGEAEPLTSLTGLMINPDFNPVAGTNEVVFIHKPVDADQSILILDLETFRFVEVYSDTVHFADPCYSFDGNWIIFRSPNWNGIYRIKSGPNNTPELIWNTDLWDDVHFHQTSPFDNTILFIETYNEGDYRPTNLSRISIDGYERPDRLTGLTGMEDSEWRFAALAESYDGERIAVGADHGDEGEGSTLWLMPSGNAGGSVESLSRVTDRSDGRVGSPAWSPDNDHVVVDLDGDLWIIDLE